MSEESAYLAYRAGRMTPEDEKQYVSFVNSGDIKLPPGGVLKKVGLPQKVWDAYHSGEMDDTAVGDLNTALETGKVEFAEGRPPEDTSLWGSIKEQVTGEARKVPATEEMGEWWSMPEMTQFSLESLKNLVGTAFTDPEETAKTIKSNSPNVDVRKDEKGNIIFKSAKDGKEYAIKPGLRGMDVLRGINQGLAWATATTTGGTTGLPGAAILAGKAAAMQTGIEGSQRALGGTFDPEQIPIAAAMEVGGAAIGKIPGIVRGVGRPPSQAQAGVKAAEKLGISPKTSDVFPKEKPTLQEGRVKAVREVLYAYGATTEAQASDEVMEELLKQRGSKVLQYKNMKGDVIDRLSDKGAVEVERTAQTLAKEVAGFEAVGSKDSLKAAEMLRDYADVFRGKDLDVLEKARKEFGNKIKDPDLGTVRDDLAQSVSKVYKSLREDMGDFIKTNGERKDFIKWKVANKRLSDSVGELKINVLKRALDKGDASPEMVRSMLFSKKPSEIKLLSRNLTPRGRRSAQVAILEEAAEKSGGIDSISPNKFLSNMNRLSKSTGIFFTKEDKKVVEGLKRALEITKSAEVPERAVGINPNISLLSLVNPASLWKSLMAAGAKSGVGAAYNSKPVRNILLQLAKVEPGKEVALMKALTAAVQVHRNVKKPFTGSKDDSR